jgi:NAD dependent epimerase/dehydratase family enzyme
VPNREFVRALGRAMHRPALIPAPAFALRLLLGEMAEALILSGQRAVPAKAERLGFTFRYKTVGDALNALFAGGSR